MKYISGKVLVLKGEVLVNHFSGGRLVKSKVYNATGTSKNGLPSVALEHMRQNAIYLYMYEHKLDSQSDFKTRVRSYEVINRQLYNVTTKRINRNNKYYYESRNADGELIDSGKWGTREIDIEDLIDKTDTA